MRLRQVLLRCLPALLVALPISASRATANIYDYQPERTFSLPAPNANAGGNVLFDALPDGRLMVLNGFSVSVETAPKSASFTSLGTISGFTPGFGPSFLTISPDGTHAAAGSNGDGYVTVFSTSNPATATNYSTGDFTGTWIDNRYLAIGNGAQVSVLDTTTSTIKAVINGIAGASAGVAVDAAGNLYAGNGDGSTPGKSQTGWVKEFSKTSWQTALSGSPINFETSGTPIADLLTADPIGFDNAGNLFVGGADFFGGSGDLGYAALVSAGAVNSALTNPQSTPPITPSSDPSVLRKFTSPQDTIDDFESPNWTYNNATGELYLNYAFGDGSVTAFAVPEPTAGILLIMAGTIVACRRRFAA